MQTNTMKLFALISSLFLASGFADSLANAAAPVKPPNVVMILSDDQAWTDFGFMGHEVIKTPHLDRLAAEKRHVSARLRSRQPLPAQFGNAD